MAMSGERDAGRGCEVGPAVCGCYRRAAARAHARLLATRERLRAAADDEEGQGTVEYAILVGVLVVIAIVAVVAFRDRIQELWDYIADSINGL